MTAQAKRKHDMPEFFCGRRVLYGFRTNDGAHVRVLYTLPQKKTKEAA